MIRPQSREKNLGIMNMVVLLGPRQHPRVASILKSGESVSVSACCLISWVVEVVGVGEGGGGRGGGIYIV